MSGKKTKSRKNNNDFRWWKSEEIEKLFLTWIYLTVLTEGGGRAFQKICPSSLHRVLLRWEVMNETVLTPCNRSYFDIPILNQFNNHKTYVPMYLHAVIFLSPSLKNQKKKKRNFRRDTILKEDNKCSSSDTRFLF